MAGGLFSFLSPQPVWEKYPNRFEVREGYEDFNKALEQAWVEATKIGGVATRSNGTPSMEPTLWGEEVLVLKAVPYKELQEGDIVTYWDADSFGKRVLRDGRPTSIIHRLVAKDKGGWIPSGDGNRHSENWRRVTKGTYMFKLMSVHRYKGQEKTKKDKYGKPLKG